MSEVILSCSDLVKRYDEAGQSVDVLKCINIDIQAGEKIAIVGASGSGKSTLLNMLGGLDQPSSGSVRVNGQELSSLDDNARGVLRNKYLGFVYQFHHLLPEFSAIENVAMPLVISGIAKPSAEQQVGYLLERVGVEHRASHKPSQLSGGERQRVAIARALAMQPKCVLLDEPTGNLDKHNADNIHALIDELSTKTQTSFVVVTHDEKLAQGMDKVYVLNDGVLEQRAGA